ncbi:hypothetical protein SLEP1_g52168 [Rubroshorea leprosula]|uniref:Uncharacterized protein n=1 Tax=Rubroshorea leprosula TaxID=152421 RepID=A0AAV5M5H1_9ROSI|nr:hypothetical protein SLEP1_g52168 [Rubroshorea leprosula]
MGISKFLTKNIPVQRNGDNNTRPAPTPTTGAVKLSPPPSASSSSSSYTVAYNKEEVPFPGGNVNKGPGAGGINSGTKSGSINDNKGEINF